ncbi:MAG: WecB/TagA/CpsF family glycosyltransferase [Deltaproteobacteria bacterium]|nr:WecB/TagA/CpsF family glycosyltransferase [Deltaproteobacteria bacterium]
MDPFPSLDLLGVRLDLVDLPSLMNFVTSSVRKQSPVTLMYLNIHVSNLARTNPELRKALHEANLVYCDGEGIRLASRFLGKHLPPRMTGADFIWDLANRCATEKLRLFWLGGEPKIAALAAARLCKKFPTLKIVGTHHGHFKKSETRSDEIISKINSANPHIVLLGMGSPIQEIWINKYREAISAPVVWCIGATADFVTGKQPRAPRWMLANGMEWLYRFELEPRRLFFRYAIGNPWFFCRLLRQRLHEFWRLGTRPG